MAYLNGSEFILSDHMLCTTWFGKTLEIIETCGHNVVQLGNIFFSGDFDSMEHLQVHFPYEAIIGGPI